MLTRENEGTGWDLVDLWRILSSLKTDARIQSQFGPETVIAI
jgi:hypothetical protein